MLRADNRHQDIAKPADNKRIGYLSTIPVDYEPDRTLPAASMAAWAEAVVRGWLSRLMGDGLHLAPPLAPAPLHVCDGLRRRRQDRLGVKKRLPSLPRGRNESLDVVFVSIQMTFHFLKVTLCTRHGVILTAVPSSDGLFYIVLRVVKRLDEQEHSSRLADAESVGQGVALVRTSHAQYAVAVFYQYGGYLHSSTGVALHRPCVSFAFYLDYRIHHGIPIHGLFSFQ